MTPKQMCELDAWLRGNKLIPMHQPNGFISKPTTDRAAAMMVLENCLSIMRDGVYGYNVEIQSIGGRFNITCYKQLGIEVEADTLPLAICLFAKKLFAKEKGQG